MVTEDVVKNWVYVSLLFMFVALCLGQTQPAVCPKHIEAPQYPLLARQTRQLGEIILSVTIDAEAQTDFGRYGV